MKNNQPILQGSEEWLEAKQSKISASEIFSLVLHYCRPELELMGFDLKEEKSFRTVQELFLKVKFGAKLSEIDPVHSEFGQGMEAYVAYRLGQELPQLSIERSKDFIVNEKLHPLAACSPDGYIELPFAEVGEDIPFLPDFDNTCKITAEWGKGAMELKTANFFANFGSEKGSRLNYIFQNQFQMMVLGLKWGCLAVLMPKEKEFDEQFFKGQVLRDIQISGEDLGQFAFGDCHDLKYYIYPELPAFQQMIMKSLNAFQADLNAYDTDQSRFPRNSEDLAGLQREKAMWAQLWPEKFGKLEIDPTSKLNRLLNERYILQEALMFAEQDKLKVECEINQLIQQEGLSKYTELKGSDNRMMWTKNGQVRFYKINKKN